MVHIDLRGPTAWGRRRGFNPPFRLNPFAVCSFLKKLLRRGPRYGLVFVHPSGLDLEAVSKLVEGGKLRAVVDRTFPLDNVR